MAKQARGRRPRQQRRTATQFRMATKDIAGVKTWLERMQVNAARAISLSEHMSPDDLAESSDLFWALVKYTENVQESAVKLDDVNKNIYPSLIEFDEPTWSGLKGMRSRLVHAFWNIDPQILWSTVTGDLPKLLALLSSLIVIPDPVSDNEAFDVIFPTQRLLGLPDVKAGSFIEAGHYILALYFGHTGRVGVVRIGHDGSRKLVVQANVDSRISVYGR